MYKIRDNQWKEHDLLNALKEHVCDPSNTNIYHRTTNAEGKMYCWVHHDPNQAKENIIIFSLSKFDDAPSADGQPLRFASTQGPENRPHHLFNHVPMKAFAAPAAGATPLNKYQTMWNNMFVKKENPRITGVTVKLTGANGHEVELMSAHVGGYARSEAAHMANDNLDRAVMIANAVSTGGYARMTDGTRRKNTKGPFGNHVRLHGVDVAAQNAYNTEMQSIFGRRIRPGASFANLKNAVVCGGDFNTPLVNNAELNKGVGIFGASKEAIDSGRAQPRATATQGANVRSKNTFDTMLHDGTSDSSASSNVKVHFGGMSSGQDGKPMDYTIDGIISMHFAAGTATRPVATDRKTEL